MGVFARTASLVGLALAAGGLTAVTDAPRSAEPLGVGTVHAGDRQLGVRRAPTRTPAPRALVPAFAADTAYVATNRIRRAHRARRGYRGWGGNASWRIVKRGRSAAVAVLAFR